LPLGPYVLPCPLTPLRAAKSPHPTPARDTSNALAKDTNEGALAAISNLRASAGMAVGIQVGPARRSPACLGGEKTRPDFLTVLGQNKRLLSRREKRARVGGRAEGKGEQAAQHNTRRRRLNPCEERRAPVPKSHNRLFRPHLPPLISAIGFKPALRCVVFGIPLRLLLLSACLPPAFPPVCK